VHLEASTKPHVHRKVEIFWTNIASTMACPNFKNGPKTGLRPLGVNRAIRCKCMCFNRIPSLLFEWSFSFLLPDWKLVLQAWYTQKLMHCILNDCNSEECKKNKQIGWFKRVFEMEGSMMYVVYIGESNFNWHLVCHVGKS
jgi:hypothetical protein